LDEIAHRLAGIPGVEVRRDVPLAPFNAYRIGGPARILAVPRKIEAVGKILAQVRECGQPLMILGGGTNILFSDRGWEGIALQIDRNLSGWRFDGLKVRVLAGTWLLDLIRAVIGRGLSGMERMAGIPGTVGGALRMNAGAFDQEIESVTLDVQGFNRDGEPFQAPRKAIDFGYRCAPALEKVVITSAVLGLKPGDTVDLQHRMEATLRRRALKQPLEYPSCGSVFKRPPNDYAGRLIEAAGLKGARIGGAMVSPKHAGFIVNFDRATAADIHRLILKIETEVYARFGVRLEREVKLIGDFSESAPAVR
jgi:UDP-N-acetylmuramate dehydrogenase